MKTASQPLDIVILISPHILLLSVAYLIFDGYFYSFLCVYYARILAMPAHLSLSTRIIWPVDKLRVL